MPTIATTAAGLLAGALLAAAPAAAGPPDSARRDEAREALRRAVAFYAGHVAAHGGYLWRYSEDLRFREGEEAASADTVWVQAPGTPAVGEAFLDAYEATGDPGCLGAARAAGDALMEGQLRSGGWTYRIELAPAARARYAYRVDPLAPGADLRSTLDDDTTQGALLFLMRLDRALAFRDARVHEAARYGLDALLAAQGTLGGFPQRFEGPADREAGATYEHAGYPADWPRTHPRDPEYWRLSTLNDDLAPGVLSVLLEAERTYGGGRYRGAALRLGDFLLRAQMPDPQPAWAQQYDRDLHPAWARRFEPPAVTGGESQGVMEALLRLSRETGEARYRAPIPRALAYLRASRLPDGSLARFYELRTNRPLFFTRDYPLTYSDADTPTHYRFAVPSRLDAIERAYDALEHPAPAPAGEAARGVREAEGTEVRRVMASLDDQGRWVEEGRLRTQGEGTRRILDSATFVRNLGVLSRYLAASAPKAAPRARPGPLSVRLADAVLARWPDPTTLSDKGWEYTNGIVLRGIAEVYARTRDPRYLDYIQRFVDAYVSEDGTIAMGEETHNLDRVQPGVLLLLLAQEDRGPRYAAAARALRGRFATFPRNAEGGFWHKDKYPDEMWLDGIYMAEPFLAGYGRLYGDPTAASTAVEQATLVARHTFDPARSLFRHAWDADGNAAWAEPATGIAPVAWSRGMGWFLMALVDILKELPADHPGRPALVRLLQQGAEGARRWQDPGSGLWYQVLDEGDRKDNWLETSGSAMFVYALSVGAERGWLDPSLAGVARKGWDGLLRRAVKTDAEGRPKVLGTVQGMGVQRRVEDYLDKQRLADAPHGLCAVLLAAAQMERPARGAGRPRGGGERADLVVAQDGSGDFASIQAALDSLPTLSERPRIVLVRNGTYREKVFVTKSEVALVGEDRARTRLVYSELRRAWRASHPDDWGAAVVNVGDDVTDFVLANMTVRNDYGATTGDHDHQFAIRSGGRATRLSLLEADLGADGGDTVSLWNATSGMYYLAGCAFEGWVDYVCPRGWCYVTDSRFFGHGATASLWHDGSGAEEAKLVVRRSRFDGDPGFALGRYHHDAQFYLLDDVFSATMADRPIGPALGPETYRWGPRQYYAGCRGEGGDRPWFADNLDRAPGAPRASHIDARWTFGGRWDPEATLPAVLPHAGLPSPANGARDVDVEGTRVRWKAGRNARAHEVRLGPEGTTPRARRVPGTTFDPGPLRPATTYRWRVDAVTPAGTVPGREWTFTTAAR